MEKTAFVTGASRGIGRAIARRLAAEGYAVGINYLRSRESAEALAGEIRAQGGRAMAVRADVAVREETAAAIRQVEDAFGPVEALVNNAGIAMNALFQDTSEELWDRMLAVHAGGCFHTIQAVLPHMLHEKRGAIVNVSSIWGLRGAACEVAYAASKAAVIGLTRSLAAELAPSRIRVNCVAPGVVATDMTAGLGEETLASLIGQTPAGRLGTPEDIAKAAAFLLREDADFITGQVLTVDGGFIL